MPDDVLDFDPWDVLLSEDELDEDEDQEVDESRSWEDGEWSSRARHPSARGLKVRPAVGTPMPAVVALLTGSRPRRGGNRLPVGHPARGRTHPYERCRKLPPDPERRDKKQRDRARIAAATALLRGELTGRLHEALTVMLDMTNDRCEIRCDTLAQIGKAAGGRDERTMGGLLARLHQLGWLQRRHRFKAEDGKAEDGEGTSDERRIRGTSNEWRIDIPEHLRAERHAIASAAGARTRKANRQGEGTGGRYTRPARGRHTGSGYAVQPPDYSPDKAQRADPNDRAESARLAREARRSMEALKDQAIRDKSVPP